MGAGREGDHPPPSLLGGGRAARAGLHKPVLPLAGAEDRGDPADGALQRAHPSPREGQRPLAIKKRNGAQRAQTAVVEKMHPASESDSDRPKAARERNAAPRPVKRASAGAEPMQQLYRRTQTTGPNAPGEVLRVARGIVTEGRDATRLGARSA
jgi:hypothetical protein